MLGQYIYARKQRCVQQKRLAYPHKCDCNICEGLLSNCIMEHDSGTAWRSSRCVRHSVKSRQWPACLTVLASACPHLVWRDPRACCKFPVTKKVLSLPGATLATCRRMEDTSAPLALTLPKAHTTLAMPRDVCTSWRSSLKRVTSCWKRACASRLCITCT